MRKKILITGGAGFIGINSATAFSAKGWDVIILDNLSRIGAASNLEWLGKTHQVLFEEIDVRDGQGVAEAFKKHQPQVVLHLAAQVAVTTSVDNPREDFDINASGTLNVLEGIRLHTPDSLFINASTNKVYGKMEDLGVVERNGRYEYSDLVTGVSESRNLDFHSPYGCSKGVADQYTIDYARVYNLRTVTLRQSCIYGPRQFGVEDQGWVAWFTIAALLNKQITVYGNGKQIRDVLHVDDLVEAYMAVIENADSAIGGAFNIGGGPTNTLSLLELLGYLERTLEIQIPVLWDDWRPGDQPVFVCDLTLAEQKLGWQPKTSVENGVISLIEWVRVNSSLFA